MNKLILIAGPCVIESEENVMLIARTVKDIAERLNLEYYFKASFDKANRTSIDSYRGPGIEKGLEILQKVKDRYGLKICTDIHEPWQAEPVSQVADIIQIPAFLCRQTDLLIAAAKTGKIINVKKAQFLAPWDMRNVVKKIEDSGNRNIMLTERGSCFGYNSLVVDMTSFTEMKKFGYPVVMDATHSVQKPGGKGNATGGNRDYVEPLAKAAVAAGADALFFEVHPDPDNALSDGPNMVRLNEFEDMLKRIIKVYDAVHPDVKSDFSITAYNSREKETVDSNMDKIAEGRRVFEIEIDAMKKMRVALNDTFSQILDIITGCSGKVIITGMGKPGHVGTKIAATLASLGTPSFFLHPAEAMHGDLGMVSENDVVIAISYSGESQEVIQILPNLKMIGATLVGITGNSDSTLAKSCDIVQVLPKFDEACYLGLAPTSSTTVEMAYGDALAVVASGIYGFKDADFGKFHPAGSLGRKLIFKVRDLMVKDEKNAIIPDGAPLKDAIIEISKKKLGVVTVVDKGDKLCGIVTNGDIRRQLEKGADVYSLKVDDIMTRTPKTISANKMAVEALNEMKSLNLSFLIVVDGDKAVGTIQLIDIAKAGIVGNNMEAEEQNVNRTDVRGGALPK